MFDLDNDSILSPSEMSLMAAGLLQIYIQYEDTSVSQSELKVLKLSYTVFIKFNKIYAPNNSKRGTVRAFFKGTTRDFAVTNRTKTFSLLERDFK